MQTRPFLTILMLMLLAAFSWQACKKSDFDNVELGEHTAEFAFPLFSTEIKLKDLLFNVLNDTLSGDTIFINPDNTMTLYYSGDVAQKPATDIFNSISGGTVPLFSNSITVSLQNDLDSVRITDADLIGGHLAFSFSNQTNDTIKGFFEVPEMSFNGVKFKHQFVARPNELYQNYGPYYMKGYELHSTDNMLTFRYEAYLPDGTPYTFPNVQPLGIFPGVAAGYDTLQFGYVQGYWGYQLYPLTRDTIEIDINQTDLRGDIKVVNPKVTMRVRNSWGFPTRGVIKYMSFIGQNGEELRLESSVFQNDGTYDYADFDYPSFIAGEVGQEKITDIYLDNTNSNIADIFNLQPTRLVYELDGVSNAEVIPSLIGFMTNESILALQMRVEMLLEGSARNFGAEQTLDLDFGEFGSLDSANIESVEFKLVTENGTPVDINAQIYFRDTLGTNIDSLFSEGPRAIMQAAPVNSQGLAQGSTRTETFIPMAATRFDKIRGTKTAFLKAYFTTAQGGTIPVKLLADNSTTVKMGIKVKKRVIVE